MTELQKSRLSLQKTMNGKFIPTQILFEMTIDLKSRNYDCFYEIYTSEKLNVLLVANASKKETYLAFWNEVFPEEPEPEERIINYLLSEDFQVTKQLWLDRVTYLVMKLSGYASYREVETLTHALYYGASDADKTKWLKLLLKKLEVPIHGYEVYLCYCVIMVSFDLMFPDMIESFCLGLEKQKDYFQSC